MLKRAVDLVIAAVGLLVLLPVPAGGGVLIKLDSDGAGLLPPGARRPERQAVPHLQVPHAWCSGAYKMGSRLTTKRDPRVTRVGQILRWFKIDELPQLINVLHRRHEPDRSAPRGSVLRRLLHAEQRARAVGAARHGRPEPDPRSRRAGELPRGPEGHRGVLRRAHPAGEARARPRVRRAGELLAATWSLLARGLWATMRGAVKTKFLWRRRHRVGAVRRRRRPDRRRPATWRS